jgi:hypothetical protein
MYDRFAVNLNLECLGRKSEIITTILSSYGWVLETLNPINERSCSPFLKIEGTRENDHSVATLASSEEVCQLKKTTHLVLAHRAKMTCAATENKADAPLVQTTTKDRHRRIRVKTVLLFWENFFANRLLQAYSALAKILRSWTVVYRVFRISNER